MIPNPHKKAIPFGNVSVLLIIFSMVIILGLSFFYISEEKKLANRIYPNVYIDNQEVGGKSKQELNAKYAKKNTLLNKINLNVVYKDQQIATFEATQLSLHTNGQEIVERAFLIGRTPHSPSRFYQKIAAIFHFTTYKFSTGITYDNTPIKEFLNDVEDQYNKPAKNALFTFENGKVTEFREDEKGLKISSDKLVADIDKAVHALDKKIENKTIVLTDEVVQPEITLAQANKLGIEELIGEGQSNFTHSSPEREDNIILAASKFNGVIIPKDKVISFDDIVGDISSLTGYKQAYVIKNGRTVLGDGGGVCQVSTTLFRAALNTGLPILERHAHAYRVLYYENDSKPGLDATIFSPSVDLKAKNDTPSSILILTEVDRENKLLYFRLYGKKDNRKVQLSEPILYDQIAPPPPLYQDDPTLPRGVVKQVDYPAWGAKASFQYKVYKDNKLAIDEKYVSVYQPWQAVYLQGTMD